MRPPCMWEFIDEEASVVIIDYSVSARTGIRSSQIGAPRGSWVDLVDHLGQRAHLDDSSMGRWNVVIQVRLHLNISEMGLGEGGTRADDSPRSSRYGGGIECGTTPPVRWTKDL